jgi:hypothetical protein
MLLRSQFAIFVLHLLFAIHAEASACYSIAATMDSIFCNKLKSPKNVNFKVELKIFSYLNIPIRHCLQVKVFEEFVALFQMLSLNLIISNTL